VAVLGVAVAKSVDVDGRYVAGYFIPSSVILKGLLYANDSNFGYTQRSRASSARSRSSAVCSLSSSSSSRSGRVSGTEIRGEAPTPDDRAWPRGRAAG
jgi:hypothetical protein